MKPESSSSTVIRTNAHRVHVALQQLAADLRYLNQIYLRHIRHRSMWSASEAVAWAEQQVTVFLRHDRERVFAVVHGDCVAMADFVVLENVIFHVNVDAREQSNAEQGPLPNKRTVHAYLTGQLVSIADHGQMPDANLWEPVEYHPLRHLHFVRSESQQPVRFAAEVRLVPGRKKVWCRRLPVGMTGEAD